MSTRLLLTTAVFILFVGCKKAEVKSCENVLCLHGNCVEGECVCPVNYAGADCGSCAADWGGSRCQENMSTYTSRYHITGRSSSINQMDTTYHPPTIIDDTVEIVRTSGRNNLLTFGTYDLVLQENREDSATWRRFEWINNGSTGQASILFKTNFDDSLFSTLTVGDMHKAQVPALWG